MATALPFLAHRVRGDVEPLCRAEVCAVLANVSEAAAAIEVATRDTAAILSTATCDPLDGTAARAVLAMRLLQAADLAAQFRALIRCADAVAVELPDPRQHASGHTPRGATVSSI